MSSVGRAYLWLVAQASGRLLGCTWTVERYDGEDFCGSKSRDRLKDFRTGSIRQPGGSIKE